MKPSDVGRAALRLAWRQKALWPFGVFLAGAAASGGARATGRLDLRGTPRAALALGVAALLLGAAAALWLHVLAEGALIDGAWRARRDGKVGARDELRAGRAAFGAVLRLKALALLGAALGAAAVAAPAALAVRGVMGEVAALGAGAALLLAATPALLTGYFVYAYALRFAVLDGLDTRSALRAAWGFVHGRVLASAKLLVLAFLGQIAGALAAVASVAPAMAAGALVLYLTGGAIAATLVTVAVGVPLALALLGAAGAFSSSVWTLAFLEGRMAEGA